MKIIGLTGGIGAGKSTVSRHLAEKGFEIIDADKISREIVMPGMPALAELQEAFGAEIVNPDGTLDRKGLAALVFGDDEKRRILEEITTRRICEIVEKRVDELRNEADGIAFIDAALLFESGADRLTDAVWAVDADQETRIARTAARDNAPREVIIARINSQMSREELLSRSDDIIDNSGSPEELAARIDELLEKYV